MDAGEEAQGRLGSGADRGETGLAMGHGVLGMAQRESLVLWLWLPHNTGHSRLQDGPSVREWGIGAARLLNLCGPLTCSWRTCLCWPRSARVVLRANDKGASCGRFEKKWWTLRWGLTSNTRDLF